MVRLYIDTHLDTGKSVFLQENQVHYLRNVLRLKTHAQIQLFNERDGEWLASLEMIGKSQATSKIESCLRMPLPEPHVTLLFAPLKPEAMHYLIEKTTELGVSYLQPITTEFTQINKLNLCKIRHYSLNAAQQCERLSVPQLGSLQTLGQVLQKWNSLKTLIVCLERQQSVPLAQLLQQLNPLQEIAFLIGPEGGLSPKDIDLLASYSFVRFCRMGSRILRAETAAVAAIACFQSLSGDWL